MFSAGNVFLVCHCVCFLSPCFFVGLVCQRVFFVGQRVFCLSPCFLSVTVFLVSYLSPCSLSVTVFLVCHRVSCLSPCFFSVTVLFVCHRVSCLSQCFLSVTVFRYVRNSTFLVPISISEFIFFNVLINLRQHCVWPPGILWGPPRGARDMWRCMFYVRNG